MSTRDEARRRAAHYLASRVGSDGLVHSPCGSRVLESALALRLLEQHDAFTELLERLRTFLTGAAADGAPKGRMAIDAALARAALTPSGNRPGTPQPDRVAAEKVLDGFRHFTAGRKRLLLDAILHVIMGAPVAETPAPHLFEATGLQEWKQAELTACKAIIAHHQNRPESIAPNDLDTLLRSQDGQPWRSNCLVHLMSLAALSHYPQHRDVVARGLAGLGTVQRPDGGLSLTPDMNTCVTGMAGAALAAAAPGPHLRRLADTLADLQFRSGGWSFNAAATQTDVETTFFVLEALHLIDAARYAATIRRGCDYLICMHNRDGGLNNYAAGAPSETSHTAQAMTIWATHDPHRHLPHLNKAAAFVISTQNPGGTYALNWSASTANVILRACHGLQTSLAFLAPQMQQKASRAVTESIDYLLAHQNPDGGWGQQPGDSSDTTSTAYAITSITLRGRSPRARSRGCAYLRSVQQPDGAFTALPDTYSPRPLLLDIEILPTIYALRALTSATSRGSV